jgi:hypothetical protein
MSDTKPAGLYPPPMSDTADSEKPAGLYPRQMTPTARQWVAAPVAPTAVATPVAPPPPPPGVHPNKQCDMSGQQPIVGWRYHKRGTDYDLCEAMWLTLPAHEQALFERIAPPPASAPELAHRLFAWRSVEGQARLTLALTLSPPLTLIHIEWAPLA